MGKGDRRACKKLNPGRNTPRRIGYRRKSSDITRKDVIKSRFNRTIRFKGKQKRSSSNRKVGNGPVKT